jgi:hypothetical protein
MALDTLKTSASSILSVAKANPIATAVVGSAVVGGAVLGSAALIGAARGRKSRSRSGRARDRLYKSKQKHEQRYKRKRKYKVYGKKGYIHPKRKNKRYGKIYYARKTGQPYIILRNGRAKFIKGKRRSR